MMEKEKKETKEENLGGNNRRKEENRRNHMKKWEIQREKYIQQRKTNNKHLKYLHRS